MSRMERAARMREERRLKAGTETTDDFGVGRVAGRKRMQNRANGTTTGGSTTTPATKAKNYNVGVSKGGVPFAESFKYHRDKGQKTFTWNGKRYTTDLKDKVKTGTGTTGTEKAEDKKKKKRRGFLSGLFKKSTDRKTAGERFRDKKAGGGMMKKKGFSQGGLSEKEPTVKKKKATGTKKGGKVTKTGLLARDKKEVMRKGGMTKKGYAKGGMTKKGYAKGGMTKKGYAKGGSVRGKPRGVGAALRGYGKALK